MEVNIPCGSRSKRYLPWLFLALVVAGIAWVWVRYQAVKDLPEMREAIEKVKAAWDDQINVRDRKIQPEFHGLRLFMTREEIYQLAGKENTREFTTEIPEVRGVLIERDMHARNYGYDAWDKNGKGVTWKWSFWRIGGSYEGEGFKSNLWMEKIDREIDIALEKIVVSVWCYFFGDLFYKMKIVFSPQYAQQVTWERFLDPTLKFYNFTVNCPKGQKSCFYPSPIVFNDGRNNLKMDRTDYSESGLSQQYSYLIHLLNLEAETLDLKGDSMGALQKRQQIELIQLEERLGSFAGQYYLVVYENNKIAKDIEHAHAAHFRAPEF